MKLNITSGIPPPVQSSTAHQPFVSAVQVARADGLKTDVEKLQELKAQIIAEKTGCEERLLELQKLLTQVQVQIDGAEEGVAIVTQGDNWRPHRRNNGTKK